MVLEMLKFSHIFIWAILTTALPLQVWILYLYMLGTSVEARALVMMVFSPSGQPLPPCYNNIMLKVTQFRTAATFSYGYVIDLVPHLFPLCRAGL